MLLTLLVWLPLTALTLVIRLVLTLSKYSAKLAISTSKGIIRGAKDGVGKVADEILPDSTKEKVYRAKNGVRRVKSVGRASARVGIKGTKIVYKTGKTVTKATVKTAKLAVGTVRMSVKALQFIIMTIHIIISAIATLISAITAIGISMLAVILILLVAVVGGGVFMSFWDDDIGVHTKKNTTVVNQSTNSGNSSGDNKVTIGNPKLEDLDTAVLNYEASASKSSHKKNCSTSLSRKDVTKFANLLMGKGNTISRGGATVCKYLCYSQTGSWGRSSNVNVIDLESFSKSGTVVNSGTFKCKAGIPFSKSKIYVMDCSTFIGWFYATFFVAYDRDNKDLDELANWYLGLRSSSYVDTNLNKQISEKELKPGDVIHVEGHVCLYIGNGKCIGASQASTGIKLGNLSYYASQSDVTYWRPYFKFRGE